MGAAGNHVGFCGDHGKTMGGGLANQPWGNPQPIDDPTIIWSRNGSNAQGQRRPHGADDSKRLFSIKFPQGQK